MSPACCPQGWHLNRRHPVGQRGRDCCGRKSCARPPQLRPFSALLTHFISPDVLSAQLLLPGGTKVPIWCYQPCRPDVNSDMSAPKSADAVAVTCGCLPFCSRLPLCPHWLTSKVGLHNTRRSTLRLTCTFYPPDTAKADTVRQHVQRRGVGCVPRGYFQDQPERKPGGTDTESPCWNSTSAAPPPCRGIRSREGVPRGAWCALQGRYL